MQQVSAPAPTTPRMNFDMTPDHWMQHGRGLNGEAGIPVRAAQGIGFVTDFPWSAGADPNAGPNWNGYLVTEISGNMLHAPSPKPNNPAWNAQHPQPLLPAVLTLDPTKRLVLEYTFDVSVGANLNYMSDENNRDTTTLAGFRPFIKSGDWGMMGSPNRWWCKQRWMLEKTDGLFRLDVALDPTNWFDVDGMGADNVNSLLPWYLAALARPTYLGLTFGGGSFAGHGVNVSNGNAVFTLLAFYTY